jgi:hypothetical protein
MNPDSTGDDITSGSTELTGSQAELLMQLDKLLCFVISDGMIDDMQTVPEVCIIEDYLLMCVESYRESP